MANFQNSLLMLKRSNTGHGLDSLLLGFCNAIATQLDQNIKEMALDQACIDTL